MHQIGSGMYVSGPAPEKKRERRLSSGSVATPPYTGGDVSRSGELGRMFEIAASSAAASPASSQRSTSRYSGPLPRPAPSPSSGPLAQLSHSGLLVGPSPAPSPAQGSWRKASRRRADEEAAAVVAVESGRARLAVPLACYMLVAVAAAAGAGAGVFCLLAWRRWQVLAAVGAAVALVVAAFAWNLWRRGAEAERFFRRFPDTVIDRGNLPVGELVKISGQVTCGRLPLGAYFHDAARCIFTSIQLYEYRGWSSLLAPPRHGCCFTWGLRCSESQAANFYISDSNSGMRFLVRAGEGAKITSMVKPKVINIDEETREQSPHFNSWLASNNISCDGKVRLKERFIKEGDTASVIGVLKKQHAYDIIDPAAGVVTTSCQPGRCLFPVLVEGLVLIGNENPDEIVYMV